MTNRCSLETCKKKLKLHEEITCRCGLLFCIKHRYAQEHNCIFDYKKEHKEKLERDNPRVIASKLKKI